MSVSRTRSRVPAATRAIAGAAGACCCSRSGRIARPASEEAERHDIGQRYAVQGAVDLEVQHLGRSTAVAALEHAAVAQLEGVGHGGDGHGHEEGGEGEQSTHGGSSGARAQATHRRGRARDSSPPHGPPGRCARTRASGFATPSRPMPAVLEPAAAGAAQRRARAAARDSAPPSGSRWPGSASCDAARPWRHLIPEGAVASVNGTPVRLEEYQRAVQALATRPPRPDRRRRQAPRARPPRRRGAAGAARHRARAGAAATAACAATSSRR